MLMVFKRDIKESCKKGRQEQQIGKLKKNEGMIGQSIQRGEGEKNLTQGSKLKKKKKI